MIASLRGRLLASVLAVAALGLLLLAGITYAELRSFQMDRVDEQARAAVAAVNHALDEDEPFTRPGPPNSGDGGPDGGPEPSVGLPPGTYGERRAADGTLVAGTRILLNYGQAASSQPKLPTVLKTGSKLTVDATSGDGSFRVVSFPDRRRGGATVIAIPLTEANATIDRLLVVEGLVIAAVLAMLGLVSWIVVRIGLLPLDRMGHTAGAIAGGDLSHRVPSPDPRTEVGRLGIALNAMLDRLERAFADRQDSEDRLRRFIADASHELRTPLASMRGYAELHRMGAVSEQADVEKAMRRIEDEAARMGVLVEDLLTLARLDQMPEVPHTAVDAAALAGDAVDDARATAPGREITLRVSGAAQVTGDAHQLRQVLANLLRNALVHTPEGTPIEVGVSVEGEQVRIEVRDHGPGLPTDDPDALFERFWRAEGGRERGKAGAGLGLAIVAGIVDAHGGSVHAANADCGGASFVVTLRRA